MLNFICRRLLPNPRVCNPIYFEVDICTPHNFTFNSTSFDNSTRVANRASFYPRTLAFPLSS